MPVQGSSALDVPGLAAAARAAFVRDSSYFTEMAATASAMIQRRGLFGSDTSPAEPPPPSPAEPPSSAEPPPPSRAVAVRDQISAEVSVTSDCHKIAAALNESGSHTAQGLVWTAARVTRYLTRHGISRANAPKSSSQR